MDQNTHLLDLNDDCLWGVFVKLTQVEYWSMRNVCQRFNNIVMSYPSPPGYKNWLDTNNVTLALRTKQMSFVRFKKFLESMHDVAENVEINAMSIDHFELLEQKQICLSNVHTLKVAFSQLYRKDTCITTKDCIFHNQDYEGPNLADVLGKAFPNVQHFIYSGFLRNTKGFAQMSKLKHLEIYNAYSDLIPLDIDEQLFRNGTLKSVTIWWLTNSVNVAKVCKYLQLCSDTLEEITLSSDFLSHVFIMFFKKKFHRLRQLTIIDINVNKWMYTLVCESVINRIRRICSNIFACWSLAPDFPVKHFNSLHVLELNAKTLGCANPGLLQVYFPQLKEIYFYNKDTTFQNHETLQPITTLTFLTGFISIPSLEILAIPLDWTSNCFDIPLLLHLLKTQISRTTILKLLCLVPNNYPEDERDVMKLKKYEHADLLQISLATIPIWKKWDNREFNYVEVEFVPDD